MTQHVHFVVFGELSQDPGIMQGVIDFVQKTQPSWHLKLRLLGIKGQDYPLTIPKGDAAMGILAGPKVVQTFKRLRCPKVIIQVKGSNRLPGMVVSDEAIPKRVAQHFEERGYRSKVFFEIGDNPESARFGTIFQQHSRNVHWFRHGARLEACSTWNLKDQILDLADLLKRLDGPVGLYCTDLEHAGRALQAVDTAGLKVPFHVGVAVSDPRTDLCSLMRPSLTQVKRPSYQIGWEAARLMDDILCGRTDPKSSIPMPEPSIMIRTSSSVWVSNSGLLDRLQQLLSEEWSLNRQPETVAKRLGTTRRTLDRHCRQCFGMTFSSQLERMRVERTISGLLNRKDSLVTLALDMGYSSQSHMTAALKKAVGKTPGQIRSDKNLQTV